TAFTVLLLFQSIDLAVNARRIPVVYLILASFVTQLCFKRAGSLPGTNRSESVVPVLASLVVSMVPWGVLDVDAPALCVGGRRNQDPSGDQNGCSKFSHNVSPAFPCRETFRPVPLLEG
ncbi:MAG TPA: hypothetical protein VLM18_11695, partial [Croceibacterium sp.]|nr:hypothetical protein [Croceibacterium sp.]